MGTHVGFPIDYNGSSHTGTQFFPRQKWQFFVLMDLRWLFNQNKVPKGLNNVTILNFCCVRIGTNHSVSCLVTSDLVTGKN